MARKSPDQAPDDNHLSIKEGLALFSTGLALTGLLSTLVETDASAGQGQTVATIGRIVGGEASELLPDIDNAYKAGTIIYKSPSSNKGNNVFGKVGSGQELLINGVIAVANPDSGNPTLWQPASIYDTGKVVWVEYGGPKTFTEDPTRGHDLANDKSYRPHMTFTGTEFIAVYDHEHATTIDNQGQIGDSNKVVVGQASFISTN